MREIRMFRGCMEGRGFELEGRVVTGAVVVGAGADIVGAGEVWATIVGSTSRRMRSGRIVGGVWLGASGWATVTGRVTGRRPVAPDV